MTIVLEGVVNLAKSLSMSLSGTLLNMMIEIKMGISGVVSQCRSRSPKRVIMLVHGHVW